MEWIVSLPNLHAKAINPNVAIFGDKAFEVKWSYKGKALIQ